MTKKELLEKLDKLRQDVEDMPLSKEIARALQGINHAIICLTPEEEIEND